MPMTRFTLTKGHWYAMEVWAEDWPFLPHASPVRVERVCPLKQGNGLLKVKFFHVNYPAGVQTKEYTLRVLHRNAKALVATSVQPGENRVLVFFPVTTEWLRTHWPEWLRDESAAVTDKMLDRIFRFTP